MIFPWDPFTIFDEGVVFPWLTDNVPGWPIRGAILGGIIWFVWGLAIPHLKRGVAIQQKIVRAIGIASLCSIGLVVFYTVTFYARVMLSMMIQ
jgi:hypothetical protein